ncbi:kinase-like protein [Obba rivulosa]|uniref:Kinase-like protein n=1 Tax=Obba rivulosa TaxID=1052685 RepID=A0A8E2DUV6_9APHY|nr:kinase-like protein [Obba rivulosa]
MYTTHVQQPGHNPLDVHTHYTNHMPNGQAHHQANGVPHLSHSSRPAAASSSKEPIVVVGIPSVTVQNEQLVVGDAQSTSTRSFTKLKVVGDGSFGTVWLCDWHGTLPPNTPMSAMQCGAGARPEYAGKRLVAVKRMKKKWEGGWDECRKLKELESLRAITYHPHIIPLYDFFLLPTTKELYFVFEPMEGNLYQLIKTRKGKLLAGGLVSSIFRQVVSGLHHIHASGYFHRDMKPENLLVTTTGLYDYRPVSPLAPPDAPLERDVVVIIKLADFGLARETRSKPPYTEYVSTRWYRAPEVLLKSRDYSNPVDMWALGTIMAELVTLKPLFPGQGEIDQIARICELLGDPVDDYGIDQRGKPVGGGRWPRGVKMAKAVGFAFQKIQPRNFFSLFHPSVPVKLIECISDLLKYDPDIRLTSLDCLQHPYLLETTPLNNPPGPPTQPVQAPAAGLFTKQAHQNGIPIGSLPSVPPRHIPHNPAANHKLELNLTRPVALPRIPDASSSHRSSFYEPHPTRPRAISDTSRSTSDYGNEILHSFRSPDGARAEHYTDSQASAYASSVDSYGADRVANSWSTHFTGAAQSDWDPMDVSPQVDVPEQMDIQTSPMVREHPSRPAVDPEPIHDHAQPLANDASQTQSTKLGKLGALGFGKKSSKWGLSMFGHGDKGTQQLPPVQEVTVASAGSTPSLKRTQSSSTDSRSLSEISPLGDTPPELLDPKKRKKEALRMAREAEKQRRLLAEKTHREQARAVMEKNRLLLNDGDGFTKQWGIHNPPAFSGIERERKGKQPASPGPIRQSQSFGTSLKTINAAGGSFMQQGESSLARAEWRRDSERVPKARRREFDDDHSMSSSDMPSLHSGVSVISFATVDSDPGPARARHRSAFGMGRMQSMSSLGTAAVDEYSSSLGQSSLSLEQQINEFHLRPSVDSSSVSDCGSPPAAPLQMLSLSSPIPWQQGHESSSSRTAVETGSLFSRRNGAQSDSMQLSIPPQPRHPQDFQPTGPPSPYEFGAARNTGGAPKSAINPIFKVPPLQTNLGRPSLPPFSELEAVADGEYPPLSPMSFTSPDDRDDDS